MHSLTVGEFKQRLGDVAWYAVFRNGVKLPNNSSLGQNDIVVAYASSDERPRAWQLVGDDLVLMQRRLSDVLDNEKVLPRGRRRTDGRQA